MSSMEDDYYVFDEEQYLLFGERNRKIYRIGDVVHVQLAKADIAKRQLEFVLVNENDMEDVVVKDKTSYRNNNAYNNGYNNVEDVVDVVDVDDDTDDEDVSEKKEKRPRKWDKVSRKVKMNIKGRKVRR